MDPMRRTVVLAAVWLVVAAGAVAVAWQGVAVVGNQVTDDRPAPLAASEIESRLSESTTTAGASGAPDGSASSTTSTSSGVATTQAATSPTTATPALPTTAAAETRTYNLRGGTASLRFSPSGVTVVFANPVPGFAVSVEPEHGNGVKVEFESGTHESRVDGWWESGPVDRVEEESDD